MAGLLLFELGEKASALDPRRALTQYSRTVWTQAQGLPQDTIRAIAQTPDGYLWVGTNEGLARFDGYDFVTFTKDNGSLPSSAVGKLLVDRGGRLWIGTSSGLAVYSQGKFTSFAEDKDGVPIGSVTGLTEDNDGSLWVVCNGSLSRYHDGAITRVPMENVRPVVYVQSVYKDKRGQLWVGGDGALVKGTVGNFSLVIGAEELRGSFVTTLLETAEGMWAGGTNGLFLIGNDGRRTHYTVREGLSNSFVLAIRQDGAGNLWVGTYGGLSRLENGRFVSSSSPDETDRDWVWSLFEDREGDLWVGMNAGLTRLRDDRFSNYGRFEGLPGDDPYVVHEDRNGTIWVGYHDSGLAALRNGKLIGTYTTRDGLSSNEIFSIRSARNGDLVIGTRAGISRMRGDRFENHAVVDPSGRTAVYDALEDMQGSLWAATARGVHKFDGRKWKTVIPDGGGSGYTVALSEAKGRGLWAGSLANGVWHILEGKITRYTTADGLSSNQIRSLYLDPDGTLWVGTLGGGLNALRDGKVFHVDREDGLLSNNIAHVQDDGRGSLWLSTTRGLCRIRKRELEDFSAGKIPALKPEIYTAADGLRSSQCAPAAPASGGGTMSSDGRLWFPTTRGVAAIDPSAALPRTPLVSPITQVLGMEADGRIIDISRPVVLDPGTRRIQIRYAGVYLSAPERIQYAFRLDGVDQEWIPAGSRRLASYSPLPHGSYRFHVRSTIPGGRTSESSFNFEVRPHFYESAWFLILCATAMAGAVYGAYRLRLRRVHERFALVSEERARLAREIHDTLAQGFVGISAQLDVLAMKINGDPEVAKSHLGLAQKMARHSLTEARRSVMDLRSSDLEEQDLPSALITSARRWALGSPVDVQVEIVNVNRRLPQNVEQNVFRIAQEAVANAVKHAGARVVKVKLQREDRFLRLRVDDDGRGFAPPEAFSVFGGHFGILGMRERAERLHGEFILASTPGRGTQVEVTIPFESINFESHGATLA